MRVTIDNKGFVFGDERFIFNLYFIEDNSKFLAPTSAETFKNIVIKWTEVLPTITIENSPVFLPYAPDDEWTDAFKVTLVGTVLEFRNVCLAENGWVVFDYDPAGFMISTHEIHEVPDDIVGRYKKDEIVSALLNAEVIDD